MTGSSVFDYIHPQDHAELAEQLGLGLASNQNLASPSSTISDDNGTNQGTNNPDGKYFFLSLLNKRVIERLRSFSANFEKTKKI